MKICPKCSHQQQNAAECEKCGLIFAKYEAVQQRKREEAEKRAAAEQAAAEKSGLSPLMLALFVLLLVGGSSAATYFFMQKERGNAPQPLQQSGTADTIALDEGGEKERGSQPTEYAAPFPENRDTSYTAQSPPIAAQNMPKSVNVGDAIQRARQATVTIKTPWGTGSGFFIGENHIVTNRHVIELDRDHLAEMTKQVNRLGEMIRLEKKKVAKIKKEMKRYDAYSKKQARLIIEQINEGIAKATPRYNEGRERLRKMQRRFSPSDITIVFDDGSKQNAGSLLPSRNYDLALLSVFTGSRPAIPCAPTGRNLQQGAKVYTIGSPAGLQQTVTSGIFSGYRQNDTDGKLYLQTDAAINPGNSGGPLIDEKGRVLGVNTMIYKDMEGIGFAIPIDTVLKEFGSSL